MALCWPDKKVALDIVDLPGSRPFEPDDDWTVVRVTVAQLEDYDGCRRIMGHIAQLLGSEAPDQPGWEQKNRRLHQALLARSA